LLFFSLAAFKSYSLSYAQDVLYADFAGAKIAHLSVYKLLRYVRFKFCSRNKSRRANTLKLSVIG
jgi:hypothetical protein